MDWNGDENIDGLDGALFHSEISNGSSGGGSSGGGCSSGCLTWIAIGLIGLQILKRLCELF